MAMFRIRRGGDTSNTVFGIILLVMLFVFIGPSLLPTVLSETFPFIDEGVPCGNLQTASNRAQHQSLIGRATTNPLDLDLVVRPIPPNEDGTWVMVITVTNTSIGTVPIIYGMDEAIVNDATNSSGFGVIIEPRNQITLQTGGLRQNIGVQTFPNEAIKLLGPKQRCTIRLEFAVSAIDQLILDGQATARAYYRITGPGFVLQQGAANALGTPNPTPVFTDQGLFIVADGFVTSEEVDIIGRF